MNYFLGTALTFFENNANSFHNLSHIKQLNSECRDVRLKYMFYLDLLKNVMVKYNSTTKILNYPCENMDFTCLPPAQN